MPHKRIAIWIINLHYLSQGSNDSSAPDKTSPERGGGGSHNAWPTDFATIASLADDLGLAYNLPGMAVAEKRSDPPDRPRSVTFVAWGVLILGAANLWRAFGFARQSDLYQLLGIKPDSTILLALALIWASVLITASVAIWLRWPPIRIVLPALIGLYGLYQLGFQAVFTRSEIALQGRAAFAFFYGAAALSILWALNRRAGRRYLIGVEEE